MAELSCEVHRTWAALDTLHSEWDALARQQRTSSWFQTASATLTLATRHDPGLTPAVITARGPAGELLGVLPLGQRAPDADHPRRRLVPLTEWHASSFDVVTASTAVAAAMWQTATRHLTGWDVADLRYVPDQSPLRDALSGRWRPRDTSKRLILGRDYLDRTPPKFAVEMRRIGRRGRLEFSATTPPEQHDEVVERFVELHSARWRDAGPAAEFADRQGRARLDAVLNKAARLDAARIGTLRFDSDIIAVHLAFRWQSVHHVWRVAHAPGWRPYSPGLMLFDLMLRHAATDGCNAAELGRGDDGYKDRWHPVTTPLWQFHAHGPTLRGRLARLKAAWRSHRSDA